MLEHEHNQLKIHLDEHEEDFLALSLEVPERCERQTPAALAGATHGYRLTSILLRMVLPSTSSLLTTPSPKVRAPSSSRRPWVPNKIMRPAAIDSARSKLFRKSFIFFFRHIFL